MREVVNYEIYKYFENYKKCSPVGQKLYTACADESLVSINIFLKKYIFKIYSKILVDEIMRSIDNNTSMNLNTIINILKKNKEYMMLSKNIKSDHEKYIKQIFSNIINLKIVKKNYEIIFNKFK